MQTLTRMATLDLGQPNCCTDCTAIGKACVCDDRRGARNMRRLRSCYSYLLNGRHDRYTPGSHNGVFFWPIDLTAQGGSKYSHLSQCDATTPLRVVHAPNHRAFKDVRFLKPL